MSASGRWRGLERPQRGELLVSEIFGPTIQGEGPSAGAPAAFLRVGMCNLSCTWCDTKYTWDAGSFDLRQELTTMSAAQVAKAIDQIDAPMLVLTGGEPAIQSAGCSAVLDQLKEPKRIEVETSGTILLGSLEPRVDQIVVSPKLRHSGIPEHARLRWPVLERLAAAGSVFKFVSISPRDLDEVDAIARRLDLAPDRVWIMPEATSPDVLQKRLSELVGDATRRGWSVSSRLHIAIWGDQRGR